MRRLPDAASARCRMPDCLADTASARCGIWQTVSSRRRLADAVCLIPACRRCVPDATMPDAVCQTAISQMLSAKQPSARLSGRRRLADGIWQTPSGRRHLADAVCQTLSARHPSAVCQTVWQMRRLVDGIWQTVSARLSGRRRWHQGIRQTASARRRLPDAVSGRWCLPESGIGLSGRRPSADGIWQTASVRHSV